MTEEINLRVCVCVCERERERKGIRPGRDGRWRNGTLLSLSHSTVEIARKSGSLLHSRSSHLPLSMQKHPPLLTRGHLLSLSLSESSLSLPLSKLSLLTPLCLLSVSCVVVLGECVCEREREGRPTIGAKEGGTWNCTRWGWMTQNRLSIPINPIQRSDAQTLSGTEKVKILHDEPSSFSSSCCRWHNSDDVGGRCFSLSLWRFFEV